MSTINRERMSLMVECEDCKEKFEITSGDAAKSVTHKKKFEVNGQSIFLTYYDCPSCGRRHYVQIDNSTSLVKLREVTSMFTKMSIAKKNGKQVSEKQLAKFKKTRQNLSDYRTKLMKEYTGKSIHNDETDSDFVLRFSV